MDDEDIVDLSALPVPPVMKRRNTLLLLDLVIDDGLLCGERKRVLRCELLCSMGDSRSRMVDCSDCEL